MMKPMPGLDQLLERAKAKGVFGTKERSVVKEANAKGVAAIVRQQFDVAKQVLAHGLVPIIEPEVDIKDRPPGHRGREAPAEGDPGGSRRARAQPARDAQAHAP